MIDKQKVQDAVDFVLGHDLPTQVNYMQEQGERPKDAVFVYVRLSVKGYITGYVRRGDGSLDDTLTRQCKEVIAEYIEGANAINKYLGREEISSACCVDTCRSL